MELVPICLASPLLLWMAYSDLRYMRIPNWLVLGLVAIFLISMPFLPRDSVVSRLFTASLVFVICGFAFAVGFFGGGDAKVLPALILLVPSETLQFFGLVFSGSMMIGLGFVVAVQMVPQARNSRWLGIRAQGMFPMGVSISIAGLVHPFAVSYAI
ncbi:prepilin peptidase CpaA [Aliiruegeria lutimaris]|uniref:Prepilin peptidase CpaA n=2 Tax=Aliiruegeria lutimaris TaxID=571298 RepID=A0A1G9JVW4_9RHOB|nr:prepilin peptidase CpaA [Aliiruegeria lutimaris]